MLLFGFAAMNGFCGAIVGFTGCAVAAAPWKAGSEGGSPVGRIGAAAAGAAPASSAASASAGPANLDLFLCPTPIRLLDFRSGRREPSRVAMGGRRYISRRPAVPLLVALVTAVFGMAVASAGGSSSARPVPHIPQPTGYALKTVNGKLRVEETDRVTPPGGGSYTNRIITIFEAKRSPIPAGIINRKRGSRSKVHIAATATVTGSETLIRSDGTRDPCSGSGSRTLRSAIDIEFRA